MTTVTGTYIYKEQGITYELTLTFTLVKEIIEKIKITSTGIKLPTIILHVLEKILVGKKPTAAQKITQQALQQLLKGQEEHLTMSILHTIYAAVRAYDNQQRGSDPFQDAFETLTGYYDGYTLPALKEHQDCPCHSDSTKKH